MTTACVYDLQQENYNAALRCKNRQYELDFSKCCSCKYCHSTENGKSHCVQNKKFSSLCPISSSKVKIALSVQTFHTKDLFPIYKSELPNNVNVAFVNESNHNCNDDICCISSYCWTCQKDTICFERQHQRRGFPIGPRWIIQLKKQNSNNYCQLINRPGDINDDLENQSQQHYVQVAPLSKKFQAMWYPTYISKTVLTVWTYM